MTTIKTMQKYDSALDLLQNEAPKLLTGLDQDTLEYIGGVDDYYPFGYFMLDQTVIVTDIITGDVIGSYDSITDFLQDILDEMEDESDEI